MSRASRRTGNLSAQPLGVLSSADVVRRNSVRVGIPPPKFLWDFRRPGLNPVVGSALDLTLHNAQPARSGVQGMLGTGVAHYVSDGLNPLGITGVPLSVLTVYQPIGASEHFWGLQTDAGWAGFFGGKGFYSFKTGFDATMASLAPSATSTPQVCASAYSFPQSDWAEGWFNGVEYLSDSNCPAPSSANYRLTISGVSVDSLQYYSEGGLILLGFWDVAVPSEKLRFLSASPFCLVEPELRLNFSSVPIRGLWGAQANSFPL